MFKLPKNSNDPLKSLIALTSNGYMAILCSFVYFLKKPSTDNFNKMVYHITK